MEGLDPGRSVMKLLEKYKYALGILLAGVALMLLPGNQHTRDPEPVQPVQQQEGMDRALEEILSQVHGAGKVKVLLTEKNGEETHYQLDTDHDVNGENTSLKEETVIVSDEARTEKGLVKRKDPPLYLGAVIVCQGGDSPQVRLAIVQAVCCVTGLSANQISVLKMK